MASLTDLSVGFFFMVAPPPRRRRGLAQKTELPATERWFIFSPAVAGPSILQELCRRVLSVAAAVGVGILALRMAIGKRMS